MTGLKRWPVFWRFFVAFMIRVFFYIALLDKYCNLLFLVVEVKSVL